MQYEPLVPIEKVAEHFSVSVSTVRAWMRQGLIPDTCYVHMANTYRFQLARLIEALLNAPKAADPEPQAPVQLELPLDIPTNNDVDRDL